MQSGVASDMKMLRQSDNKARYLFDGYVVAKDFVIAQGFAGEIDWQAERSTVDFSERDFLREGAWAILSSGMREETIRSRFPLIQSAFLDFERAKAIVENRKQCIQDAQGVFRHPKKLCAIVSLACRVLIDGFSVVRASTLRYGADYLETFDYLGPATSRHLAKNLGLDVAKPDRHLSRVAEVAGFTTVDDLCSIISEYTGDPKPVVDIVIWRFATLQPDYLSFFKIR